MKLKILGKNLRAAFRLVYPAARERARKYRRSTSSPCQGQRSHSCLVIGWHVAKSIMVEMKIMFSRSGSSCVYIITPTSLSFEPHLIKQRQSPPSTTTSNIIAIWVFLITLAATQLNHSLNNKPTSFTSRLILIQSPTSSILRASSITMDSSCEECIKVRPVSHSYL